MSLLALFTGHRADLARRLATLEERHYHDQQALFAADLRNGEMAERLRMAQSLSDANARECRRLTRERDQALAEVQRLSDELRRRAPGHLLAQTYICHN